MHKLKELLSRHYGLSARQITPRQGGWSALAYQVETEEGLAFLKMYEKSRASTPKWTALIDQYVPLLLRLHQYSSLQGKLPVPLLTVDGRCKCENDDGIFLLYEHIDGETIGSKSLTDAQIVQLADIMAELHTYDEVFVLDTLEQSILPLKEDFELPFLPSLYRAINELSPSIADAGNIHEVLAPFKEPLIALMDSVRTLSQRLRQRSLRYVLCHTDLHHWNLMSSDGQLILIDWEGIRIAPVEADWMFIVDKPYYEDFLTVYRKRHPSFVPDPECLSFYQGRRRLEDIWEFTEQLLYDTQDAEEQADALSSLRKELQQLPLNPR